MEKRKEQERKQAAEKAHRDKARSPPGMSSGGWHGNPDDFHKEITQKGGK